MTREEPGAQAGAAYAGTRLQLFLLGAAKSGTTTLARWLGDHPHVLLSEPKEPYFFELLYDRGVDDYWRHCFADRWTGEPVVVDARHRNLYLPYVPERIERCAPDPRFLAILREPISRALSHWWHWRSRGIEPLDFAAAVRADWERMEDGVDFTGDDGPALWAQTYSRPGPRYNAVEALTWRTYVDTGFYAEQLRRYVERFGRERLLVLFTDDLRDDPEALASRVASFAGIALEDAPELGHENRALGARRGRSSDVTRDSRWRSIARAVLPAAAYRRLGGLVARPPQGPTVDARTRAFLAEVYAPHNAQLAELIGRPLPAAWSPRGSRAAGIRRWSSRR